MAIAGNVNTSDARDRRRVAAVRIGIVALILAAWESAAASGLFLREVVPSLAVVARNLATLLSGVEFYRNLGITAGEIAAGVAIGGLTGLGVGIALGANRFVAHAYESVVYYLGPTPKIIFFPVMIMWFGVGVGSKIAMASVSCFFPVAISVAAGMRQIERVHLLVGRSFRATFWQTVWKIYLPAMRSPIANGVRLGLGVAVIGTLLAETKLSNQGLGYLVIQAYARFDMARMYALLIILFVLAIAANALIGRVARPRQH